MRRSERTRNNDVTKHYTLEVKNLLVEIAENMIKEHGKSVKDVHEYFREINRPVGESTLRLWRQEYRRRGEATSISVGGGRPPLLDDLQEDIFSGHILSENEKGRNVCRASLALFALENFDVDMTPRTAGNYARKLGFRFRDHGTGGTGNTYSHDELTELAFSWLQLYRVRNVDPSNVCCIDFTYTSHRKLRVRGMQRKGKKKSQVKSGHTRFTNCIVVCAFADGSDRAPPMMFTYDARFDFERRQTANRSAETDRIQELHKELQLHGVSPEDVVYLEPPKTKSGQPYSYVGESKDILRQFLEKRKVPKNVTIFHDSGTAFGGKKSTSFKDLGYENCIVFEPAVHQYLSVCDNNWIGAAKQKWNAKFQGDFTDNVSSSLWLLAFLRITYPVAKMRFSKNYLMGSASLDKADVSELITGRKGSVEEEDDEKKYVYYYFMGLDGNGNEPRQGGDPGLDGIAFWPPRKKKRSK